MASVYRTHRRLIIPLHISSSLSWYCCRLSYFYCCICMYVSVTLRNVNLRSPPGRMSDTCITRRFLATEDGEDNMAGPLQHMYLGSQREAMRINKCWMQPTIGDSEKKKNSAHRWNQESDRRTRKSSKVESTYWRFFTSQVFRLTLQVPLFCTKQRLTLALRTPLPWRLERREALYACVVLAYFSIVMLLLLLSYCC